MYNIVTDYHAHMLAHIHLGPHSRRVVVDAGNGTGGVVAVPILQALGQNVTPLYCDMDGHFPHHHPDPTVEANLTDLIATVRREGADLGIGYDGDADRIGVVDEHGAVIWGDRLMILLARQILSEQPGATFVSEVKCSQTLYDDIEKHGGRAVMWAAGHSLIKAKMKETHAALGGEMSGHIFFEHRYFGFDDAIYATLRLLEIATHTKATLSELLADVPKTAATPEIRMDCLEATKFAVVKDCQSLFASHFPTITVDGARVQFAGGWGLIRASNTGPLLVLRFEATSTTRLEQIRENMSAIVQAEVAGQPLLGSELERRLAGLRAA